MAKSTARAEKIERAIRLTWESLDSHLEYASGKKHHDSPSFHKKCVKDYSELMKLISELY
jgi:hypothetical protein